MAPHSNRIPRPAPPTGSVAAVKARELCARLLKLGELRVVATAAARKFLQPGDIPPEALPLLGVSERLPLPPPPLCIPQLHEHVLRGWVRGGKICRSLMVVPLPRADSS